MTYLIYCILIISFFAFLAYRCKTGMYDGWQYDIGKKETAEERLERYCQSDEYKRYKQKCDAFDKAYIEALKKGIYIDFPPNSPMTYDLLCYENKKEKIAKILQDDPENKTIWLYTDIFSSITIEGNPSAQEELESAERKKEEFWKKYKKEKWNIIEKKMIKNII